MKYDASERGHTMLEVISVLGFLAVLSAGIVRIVSTVYDKYKVGRVTAQVEEIRKVISNRYLADGSFVDLSVANLIKDGIAPNDMISGDSTLSHAFNGEVKLKGYSNRYTITFEALPLQSCIELSMMNWAMGDSSNLINLKINSDNYRWPTAPGATTRLLPIKLLEAGNSCSGDNNKILWNFQ